MKGAISFNSKYMCNLWGEFCCVEPATIFHAFYVFLIYIFFILAFFYATVLHSSSVNILFVFGVMKSFACAYVTVSKSLLMYFWTENPCCVQQ